MPQQVRSTLLPGLGVPRVLCRYGAAAMLLWLWATAAALIMACPPVRPRKFEATAWLIVRLPHGCGFAPSVPRGTFSRYQKTQAELINSPQVLRATLASHPEIVLLPSLLGSDDPGAEMGRRLRVKIVPDTNLIAVSISFGNGEEAIHILDAVVDTYLVTAQRGLSDEQEDHFERLEAAARLLKTQIATRKQRLRGMALPLTPGNLAERGEAVRQKLDQLEGLLKRFTSARLQRIELENELAGAQIRAERVTSVGSWVNKGALGPTPKGAAGAAVSEWEAELAAGKKREAALNQELAAMKNENGQPEDGLLDIDFALAELDADKRLLLSIQNLVNQMEYDCSGPRRVDRANKRTQVDPQRPRIALSEVAGVSGVLLLCLVVAGGFVEIATRRGRLK